MAHPAGDSASTKLRLKPADSFDLIRLLARSQYDPRKAVCELVQNSLDAQAKHVEVHWLSEKGERVLRVYDDGRGIFPELSRRDALNRIATTIGHSHKRSLTPAERRELMALGKYGIGLLGFWSVGKAMQIRSRVGGGDAWCLRMEEDSPDAQLERARPRRLAEDDTYTEVTISGVHEAAQRQIKPGRLQAYLASELRGQLLGRDVALRIHDKVARGRAVKEFVVAAQRFRGQLLQGIDDLAVPGFDEARVELYLVPLEEQRTGVVQLACGGTTVLDDLARIDGADTQRAPWSSGRFEGVIDFPHFDVAPSTRRNFRPDAAAEAFLAALPDLEAKLTALLGDDDARRREEADRNLAKRIQKVFRQLGRSLPEYDFFDVRGARTGAARGDREAASGEEVPRQQAAMAEAGDDETGGDETTEPSPEVDTLLFAPGPLAQARLAPARSRIPPAAARTLTARALDSDARPVSGAVAFTWSLDGPGSLTPDGTRAVYVAPASDAQARVTVTATQGEVVCSATAQIVVEDTLAQDRGIPDPTPVHSPAENWRSRYRDNVWEYNTAHRDYIAASAGEARRMRYLLHLFAKEIVLRNFGGPGDGATLERMVEVLTYLDEARGKRSEDETDA